MTRLPIQFISRGAFILLAALGLAGLQQATDGITEEGIRSHLLLLSSDRLEGRAPGTQGADIAAEYIASRFVAMGLEPVDGSYFQPFPVTGVTTDPTTVSLAFEDDSARLPARYPQDAVIWPGVADQSLHVSGELVFVGYGIEAPTWGWDDFKGRNLSGKILIFLVGDPPAPPDDPALFDGRALTYYGRWSYKLDEARRRGATGALIVHRPEAAGYEWQVVASSWTSEQLILENDDSDRLLLNGWVTADFAGRLFDQAGLDLDELAVRAARRDFRPVETGLTVRARMNSRGRAIHARNVVGYLPGQTEELVVLTAHYDHLGVGPAVDGDSIYNGAYDNASGVSVLLEVAHALTRVERPRRGILFLATSGEEAGLLGSRHYVRDPLFPLEATTAAINTDGANLWGETDDAIAVGAERSTLGTLLADRGAQMGLSVRTDPVPERGGFFRSDQFPFAQAGIPAAHLQHGLAFRGRPEGWGDSLMTGWLRDHYHRPSDEIPAEPDLTGAVQQARLLFGAALDLASTDTPPVWHPGVTFPFARTVSARGP